MAERLPGAGSVDISAENKNKKPWGYEQSLFTDAELEITVGKVVIKAGEKTSVQKHDDKDETFAVRSGELTVAILSSKEGEEGLILEERKLKPGQRTTIERGTIHYTEAGGGEDCVFVEFADKHDRTDRIYDWPKNVARRKGDDKAK